MHLSRHTTPDGRRISHVPTIANMAATTGLICPDIIRTDDRSILFGDKCLAILAEPVGERFIPTQIAVQCVRLSRPYDGANDPPNGILIQIGRSTDFHPANIRVNEYFWQRSGQQQNATAWRAKMRSPEKSRLRPCGHFARQVHMPVSAAALVIHALTDRSIRLDSSGQSEQKIAHGVAITPRGDSRSIASIQPLTRRTRHVVTS